MKNYGKILKSLLNNNEAVNAVLYIFTQAFFIGVYYISEFSVGIEKLVVFIRAFFISVLASIIIFSCVFIIRRFFKGKEKEIINIIPHVFFQGLIVGFIIFIVLVVLFNIGKEFFIDEGVLSPSSSPFISSLLISMLMSATFFFHTLFILAFFRLMLLLFRVKYKNKENIFTHAIEYRLRKFIELIKELGIINVVLYVLIQALIFAALMSWVIWADHKDRNWDINIFYLTMCFMSGFIIATFVEAVVVLCTVIISTCLKYLKLVFTPEGRQSIKQLF